MNNKLKLFLDVGNAVLIKAIEVISQNGYLPYIVCKTDCIDGLPEHLYSEKFITLDVSTTATGEFNLTDTYFFLDVRFSGKEHTLDIPLVSIVCVNAVSPEGAILGFTPNAGVATSQETYKDYMNYCETKGYDNVTSGHNGNKTISDEIQPKPRPDYLKRIK